MNDSKNIFASICLLLAIVGTSALPLAENNALAEFFGRVQLAAPNKESFLVKRRVYENNNDGDGVLKQISLRSLIGDLEQGLFASAVKESKNVGEKDKLEPKNTSLDETPAKEETTTVTESLLDESIANSSVTENSTHKVAQTNSAPTHIVIDRIAIQPHTGGIAFIPIFELKRSRKDEDSNNSNHEVTKITISKTEITSLATALPESSSSVPQISTSTASTTIAPEKTTKAAEVPVETTPKNIEQLKEVEEDLKEKVAEIEAEPIILSARV